MSLSDSSNANATFSIRSSDAQSSQHEKLSMLTAHPESSQHGSKLQAKAELNSHRKLCLGNYLKWTETRFQASGGQRHGTVSLAETRPVYQILFWPEQRHGTMLRNSMANQVITVCLCSLQMHVSHTLGLHRAWWLFREVWSSAGNIS